MSFLVWSVNKIHLSLPQVLNPANNLQNLFLCKHTLEISVSVPQLQENQSRTLTKIVTDLVDLGLIPSPRKYFLPVRYTLLCLVVSIVMWYQSENVIKVRLGLNGIVASS